VLSETHFFLDNNLTSWNIKANLYLYFSQQMKNSWEQMQSNCWQWVSDYFVTIISSWDREGRSPVIRHFAILGFWVPLKQFSKWLLYDLSCSFSDLRSWYIIFYWIIFFTLYIGVFILFIPALALVLHYLVSLTAHSFWQSFLAYFIQRFISVLCWPVTAPKLYSCLFSILFYSILFYSILLLNVATLLIGGIPFLHIPFCIL